MSVTTLVKGLFPEGYDPAIIDAHHHFWDVDGAVNVPWITGEYNANFFLGKYHSIRHTFMADQYKHATAGWNILGTVHCEAEVAHADQIAESAFLSSMHDADPKYPLAAVGHVLFLQDNLEEILEAHSKYPLIRGIRSKPIIAANSKESVRGESGSLQDPRWREGLKRLQDYNFSWDLRVPYYHLSEAAEVVSKIPETTVIINHCGLPLDRSDKELDLWRRGLQDLASCPNTYIKVSEFGLYPNVWDHDSNVLVAKEVLDIFGYERSMFASNLPVALVTAQSFNDVMAVFADATHGASKEQLDSLFHGTAAKAYRIRSV